MDTFALILSIIGSINWCISFLFRRRSLAAAEDM